MILYYITGDVWFRGGEGEDCAEPTASIMQPSREGTPLKGGYRVHLQGGYTSREGTVYASKTLERQGGAESQCGRGRDGGEEAGGLDWGR